jgi:hypothetical protein
MLTVSAVWALREPVNVSLKQVLTKRADAHRKTAFCQRASSISFLSRACSLRSLTHPPLPFRCLSSVFGLCRVSENFPNTSASHSRVSGCVFSPGRYFSRSLSRAHSFSSLACFRRIYLFQRLCLCAFDLVFRSPQMNFSLIFTSTRRIFLSALLGKSRNRPQLKPHPQLKKLAFSLH